jgi:hypothetical protein
MSNLMIFGPGRRVLGVRQPYVTVKICLSMILMVVFFLLTGTAVSAFPPGMEINGNVTFDEEFANGITFGNHSQTGEFYVIEGGGKTTSTFDGATVTGNNPQEGVLTDMGDGIGFSGMAEGGFLLESDLTQYLGTADAGYESEFGIGIDFGIGITNNASTAYQLTFKVDFSNFVDANGPDAYAHSDFEIEDPDGIVFLSDIKSDTLEGDEIAGDLTGNSGEAITDSGSFFFDLIVEPTMTADIGGYWTLEGGTFAENSTAMADFEAFISVDGYQPVPEPGTIFLLSTGLIGMAAIRGRSKK